MFVSFIATPGKAVFLLKKGAKLNRKRSKPKRYAADLQILKRNDFDDEEEEKDENE